MQYWKSEAIYEVKCPQCNHMVEFYKDDPSRKCSHCGHRFVNPKMDFGCASYCQFAEQCLGTLPEEFVAQKDNLLKDRVAVEVKKFFKSDFKRISHATRVARHAERIGKSEEANLAIILCSSYLKDIGAGQALEKNKAATRQEIEKESVAITETILKKLGAKEQLIKQVCGIIASNHSPGSETIRESDVVHDANLIAAFAEDYKNIPIDLAQFTELVNHHLRTKGGQQEARETFKDLGAVTV
jgi:hypothetical protein